MPTFRNSPIDAVIDVRSKMEFDTGHLEGARCLPVDSLDGSIATVPGLTTQSRILLYCASGGRSALGAHILGSLGYTHVVDGGGITSAERDFAR